MKKKTTRFGEGRVLLSAVRELVEALLDLIYPSALYCICCGRWIDETRPYRLCNDCMTDIKWATGRCCQRCGKPLSAANPTELCFYCRSQEHAFDRGYTCAEYGALERALLFRFKYNGRTDLAATLAEILCDRMRLIEELEEQAQVDLVIPVPMYAPKQRRRGFNQAELLAKAYAGRRGLPCMTHVVLRVRDTKAMRGLAPEERRRNIAQAFVLAKGAETPIDGKHILLIDDIYTTGATVDALAELLRRAGARRISVLTFAAGADVIKHAE